LAKAKLTQLLKNSYVKTILLGVILLCAVFAFWFGLRLGLRTDYPLLAVASGSMTPTLNVGDLIIVQGVPNYNDLYAAPAPDGTIIVFHKPSDTEELIVHRGINKVDENGTWFFQTKGDNNLTPDYWIGDGTLNGLISQRLLVGKVVAVVPWVGNVPLFIRTPSGLLLIILLFLVILFIEYVPVLSKKAKGENKAEDKAGNKAES
jgi:signal peptidase I